MHQVEFNAGSLEFVKQDNRIGQAPGEAIERDGIHSVDQTHPNALAEPIECRAISPSARDALVVESLADPFVEGAGLRVGEIEAGLELSFAR